MKAKLTEINATYIDVKNQGGWIVDFVIDKNEHEITYYSGRVQASVDSEYSEYCEGGYVVATGYDLSWIVDDISDVTFTRLIKVFENDDYDEDEEVGVINSLCPITKKDWLNQIENHFNAKVDCDFVEEFYKNQNLDDDWTLAYLEAGVFPKKELI